MKTNNIKLESGQTYTLSQLFSGENNIIIPDLQRDYCWGDKVYNDKGVKDTELVSGFVNNLISIFNEKPNDNLTLGLIYGYENPRYHIQLCDGQQRITTLFLLLGMINRKTGNHFSKNLISDYERNHDDKEPYLQYAIRESTLYFLSDLVCEYFLNGDIATKDIQKQNWYFDEYDLDASIKSMLAAIKTIEGIFISQDEQLNYLKFGEFILENLQMLYYDMGNRTRGEETFVIINTTGEPLTATENLKPILLGNLDNEKKIYPNKINEPNQETEMEYFSRKWEDREEWFWQNRKSDKEQTSDAAMNDFFVWYWQIRLLQEKSWKNNHPDDLNPREIFLKKPTINSDDEENPDLSKWEKSTKPDTIHQYFSALEKLIELCKIEHNARVLKTIYNKEISLSWFRNLNKAEGPNIILPLIAYLVKFDEPKEFNTFVRRIRKNYFDKKWKDRNKNFVDWRYIIQIIQNSRTEDNVFCFETTTSGNKIKIKKSIPLNEWYNEEEKWKTKLKKQYCKKIEEWENHPDFMGDLSFLISINSNADFNDLSKYYTNYTSTIDLIRNKYGEKVDEKDNGKIKTTNLIRLFLLFVGCNKVGHMPRVTREAEGVLFSTLNREHLHKAEFKRLITSENILQHLETYIKEKVRELDLLNLKKDNFTTDKAIKIWLTLKVFNAIKEKVSLAFYDGNDTGVAIYINPEDNKLIDSEPFSIENFICGFGVKAGRKGSKVHYTSSDLWLKNNIINTPFAGVAFSEKERKKIQIDKNKSAIDKIIEFIED